MINLRMLAVTTLLLGFLGNNSASFCATDESKTVKDEKAEPAGASAPTVRGPWTPEDIIYAESANQYRISPDGKWLVWAKSTGDKEKDARVSNLFLSSMNENREIQLTRGTDSVSQPRWSPDSEWIAFLGSKPLPGNKPDAAKMQIWLINAHGGEAYPLTDLARAPRKIEWLDKNTLIYNAEEDPALYEQEQKKKKDDSEVIEDVDHASPVRLYKIEIKDKKITRLTANTDWIENWGVSRDGRYVAASHAKSLRYAFDQKTPPVIILHDLSNGHEKQILTEARIRAEGFEWALDNSGFYVATPFSSDAHFMTAGITIVYFFDVATGKGYAGQSRLGKWHRARACRPSPADLLLCSRLAVTMNRPSTPSHKAQSWKRNPSPASMREIWRASSSATMANPLPMPRPPPANCRSYFARKSPTEKSSSPVQIDQTE